MAETIYQDDTLCCCAVNWCEKTKAPGCPLVVVAKIRKRNLKDTLPKYDPATYDYQLQIIYADKPANT